MTGDHHIERRAAALAAGGTAEISELDRILTDAAAEAVSIRAELLRVNRRLAAVLDHGERELDTLDQARELEDRRGELSTRLHELSGLLRKLRTRRDRLAG